MYFVFYATLIFNQHLYNYYHSIVGSLRRRCEVLTFESNYEYKTVNRYIFDHYNGHLNICVFFHNIIKQMAHQHQVLYCPRSFYLQNTTTACILMMCNVYINKIVILSVRNKNRLLRGRSWSPPLCP